MFNISSLTSWGVLSISWLLNLSIFLTNSIVLLLYNPVLLSFWITPLEIISFKVVLKSSWISLAIPVTTCFLIDSKLLSRLSLVEFSIISIKSFPNVLLNELEKQLNLYAKPSNILLKLFTSSSVNSSFTTNLDNSSKLPFDIW